MSNFVWGIKNGELDIVQEHLKDDSIDINKQINGRYPLHYAADYGQLEVLRFLIAKGADVNVDDKHGISPLLAAIWEGHTACVELLLAKGAKKDGKTPEGVSYLEAAEKDEIKRLLSS